MRQLEVFPTEEEARDLAAVLHLRKIANEIREGRDGWNVWVIRDEQMPQADAVLQQHLESQGDDAYAAEIAEGRRELADLARQPAKPAAADGFREIRMTERYRPLQMGVVTGILIGISVLVAVLTKMGSDREAVRKFTFIAFDIIDSKWVRPYPLFHNHEYWRLLSPIFLHFGIIHLVFNMWWLKDFGAMIESRRGPWYFLALVLVGGIGANVMEYGISRHLMFGGMSGVNYALFGYIWMRAKFDPNSGYFMHNNIVYMLVGWFILCWTGVLGPIANWAHTGGLVLGMAWGYAISGDFNRRRRQAEWRDKHR